MIFYVVVAVCPKGDILWAQFVCDECQEINV